MGAGRLRAGAPEIELPHSAERQASRISDSRGPGTLRGPPVPDSGVRRRPRGVSRAAAMRPLLCTRLLGRRVDQAAARGAHESLAPGVVARWRCVSRSRARSVSGESPRAPRRSPGGLALFSHARRVAWGSAFIVACSPLLARSPTLHFGGDDGLAALTETCCTTTVCVPPVFMRRKVRQAPTIRGRSASDRASRRS